MKLDIEKIKQQIGATEEEFAEEMAISVDELRHFSDGSMQLPGELLSKMCQYTGLQPAAGGIFVNENSTVFTARPIDPNDTYEPSKMAKTSLVEYIKQGVAEFKEETVKTEIEKIQRCVNTIRKPRISFAGQSDTGKSTLINALLGAERMPAKWTPTTSIVVYIKHIDDKPSFIKENVWILGKKSNELWDDNRLADEEYCKEFLIAKGDYLLLSEFGTHQHEKEHKQISSAAVAFIDSPLLKNCDILDLPGFAATSEDDALHRFNTQENVTDILIYLSRSNGFLQDRDLDYLRECLKSLRPVEQAGVNNLGKLGNLFIIASQAGAVNNGNSTELTEILDRRCKALCDSYALAASNKENKTLLPFRSAQTGYDYDEEDFRLRFFTYEKDMPRLCKKFNTTFTSLAEDLPKSLYKDFCDSLKEMIASSNIIIQNRVDEWNCLLSNKTKYVELVREIKQKEPARKIERTAKASEMIKMIKDFGTSAKQEIQSMYTRTINTEYLVYLIEKHGVKNKKGDKEDFATTVNELMSSQVQSILAERTKEYSSSLDDYLKEYAESFGEYSSGKDIDVKFDTLNSFALGLASLGALGASAAWLATSFTAFSVSILGSLAGWGSILAVGGVVGIAIGAVIAGLVSIFKSFTWKKDLAKTIISAYEKENYLDTVFKDVEKYWKDTQKSFTSASDRVEKDWQKRIEEYESIADEKNIPILETKIVEAKRGLDFFTKMPLPEIG